MRVLRVLPFVVALAPLGLGCEQSTGPADDDPGGDDGLPIIRSFVARKSTIALGEFNTLSWKVDRAALARISGIGVVAPTANGSLTIRPAETTNYTLTVSNPEGTDTATATVEVEYGAGVFVSPVTGDDGATGDTPATALKTLDAALGRTQGGGFIYLASGVYPTEIVIENTDVSILGALDPETFLPVEDPDERTTIQPGTGVPLTLRNTGRLRMTNLDFADSTGLVELPVLIENSVAEFMGCTFDGRQSTEAVAVRVVGDSDIDLVNCRIFGGYPPGSPPLEASGVEIRDASSALISHCFIDGGRAEKVCSGVDLDTSGTVRIGLSTIAAETTSPGGLFDNPAAVRIRRGNPFLGGNIFFTRGGGGGRRLGVAEEAAGTDPRALEYNLFISVSPPYDNFGSNNDPDSENDLNNGDLILEANPDRTTYRNILSPVSADELFAQGAIDDGDFHLVSPLLSGLPNPAVNRGGNRLSDDDYIFVDPENPIRDIDGDRRPGDGSLWNLGADEF